MEEIILGHGMFSVGEKDIALTRGGGKFVLEREYREIEADGDKGPVKNRIVKDRSVPKLTMNALTLIPADYKDYYPALEVSDSAVPVGKKVTGAADIATTDYKTVKWTGVTKGGKGVIITLYNAINLENIDWEMVDKDEVIQALNYTGTYDDANMETEPWDIVFVS